MVSLMPQTSVLLGSRGEYRWSLQDYARLGRAGLFQDQRTELIHGRLFVMPLPDEPHTTAVMRAADWCRRAFGPNFTIREEKAFVVDDHTDAGPDVAVISGPFTGAVPAGKPRKAALIIEVSYSTLDYDLGEKARVYAAAGVADYWVLDGESKRLFVHRDVVPSAESETGWMYRTVLELSGNDSIAPLVLPAVTVFPSDLLPK